MQNIFINYCSIKLHWLSILFEKSKFYFQENSIFYKTAPAPYLRAFTNVPMYQQQLNKKNSQSGCISEVKLKLLSKRQTSKFLW